MTLAAILLLVISAAMHASWNFISKKNSPTGAFLLVANTLGCLIFLPFVFLFWDRFGFFPKEAWILVMAAGVFQALYYTSLAGAYRAGDMSLAYPLARSSPVIVVTFVTFMLGQGGTISSLCVFGIILVVAGCFMVPMATFRDFRLRNYLCRTCAFALLAAVGTAGYSIVDAEALRAIRTTMGGADSIVVVTILYAFAEALASSLFLFLYVSARASERFQLGRVMKTELRMAFVTGIGIYLTYALVLISMSMVKNVSYVVGFRQLSIPIGVFLGVVFLKEPVSKPKIYGVATLVTGLLLIATG
ncbi:MAG: EamA family transporter [Desulfobacterales bacterium]|nr:EamA family transporter [Desulfobacterales bacterium]